MEERDVTTAMKLVNEYLTKYSIHPVFTSKRGMCENC